LIYYKTQVTPSPVFIDTIAVSLSVPYKQRETVHLAIAELQQYYGSYAPRGKFYQYATNLNNSSEDPNIPYEHKLMVQWYLKGGGDPYLRLKWNPNKISMEEVKYFINQILEGGYQQLVQQGRVTEVHFSIDFVGADMDRMLFNYPKMQREASNRVSGHTEYLGCRAGATFIRLYDKAAEIAEFNKKNPKHKQPKLTQPTVRLEIVKRSKSNAIIWMRDLPTMPNPFAKFEIWGVPVSKYDEKHSLFWMSLAVWQDRGRASMMSKLKMSPDDRKQYAKQFKKKPPAWWQPNQLWEGYINDEGFKALVTD